MNPCKKICQNFLGGFKCACPKGFKGDGMKNGMGCTVSQSRTKTTRLALCKCRSYCSNIHKFNSVA